MTNHPVKLSCFAILPDQSGMVHNKWSLIAMDASVNGYFHFKLKSSVQLNGKTAACWSSATTLEIKAKCEQIKAKHEQIKAKYEQIRAKHEQIKAKYEQIKAKHEHIIAKYGETFYANLNKQIYPKHEYNQTCHREYGDCNSCKNNQYSTNENQFINQGEPLLKTNISASTYALHANEMISRMSRARLVFTHRVHSKREREPSRIPYKKVFRLFRKKKIFKMPSNRISTIAFRILLK